MYSLRGAPPVVLGAAVPEAAEFAVPLLELLPPHAAGRADDARALEEAAAVKLMRFKIDAHWNLILPDLYFPIF